MAELFPQVPVAQGEYRAVELYPPMSVWNECDAAAARAAELAAQGREVHFELAGRLGIELRGEDGEPLRRLSACDVLAIAGGAPA